MKTSILKILRETSEYTSGQDLCNLLGVSRTMIWKAVKQLKEQGYQIESVSNRGYKLISSPNVITASEIGSILSTKWIGKEIIYHQEVDSTNLEAKRIGEQSAAHGTLVIAEKQTNGQGRRGRYWLSDPGEAAYFTVLLRPDIQAAEASMLTLVAALAVCRGIELVTGVEADIKWPNDVVLNGKKMTGILTEMSTAIDYISYVVIGIGININISRFPEELVKTATSLYMETKEVYNRALIIAKILESFEYYYAIFEKTKSLKDLVGEYNSKLINCGRQVRILNGKDQLIRTALGINQNGALLVEDDDKNIETIVSGEVSVRGLYGYV